MLHKLLNYQVNTHFSEDTAPIRTPPPAVNRVPDAAAQQDQELRQRRNQTATNPNNAAARIRSGPQIENAQSSDSEDERDVRPPSTVP